MKLSRETTVVLVLLVVLLSITVALAQETTGGLQGTVKDTSGAVVPNATVTVSGPSLVGTKRSNTDSSGYFRFANLPPGSYTVTVTAQGFSTLKHEGQVIEVGHLPSIDLQLKVGGAEQVVEVTANAATIDTTTTRTITNITQDVINDVPKGRSFQSVIQFAPAARNEPLSGQSFYSGISGGGSSPGSGSNGLAFGYSVAGGSDSENAYLVEGQETANIIGGYSATNVPFEFIQEVQIKSSGIESEHGGSLGGVVNVIMKKGGNGFHGQAFTYFESNSLDGSPAAYLRYDPTSSLVGRQDAIAQIYQPKRDNFKIVQPGFTIGGPIAKDRLWFFLGFDPQYNSQVRTVDFQGSNGLQTFNRDTQTYYTTARLDAALTDKIRVYGSWLTQYTRQSGALLPLADAVQGYQNASITTPIESFTHGIGFSAPNSTYAIHGDVTVSPTLILTTAYGYSFTNYHDFGYPISGDLFNFQTNGIGGTDSNGNPLPPSLQQQQFTLNLAYNPTFTFRNAQKHYQFDQDVAWFKSGWWGTHNFKFGYQLNHLANNIVQLGNVPNIQIFPYDKNNPYNPASSVGVANCANVSDPAHCEGQLGYIIVNDYGTAGVAANYNHGLFGQDAWTIGKGLTLNLGIRVDKEYLPAAPGSGLETRPINFSWADKIAPRVGASWDVFRNGKMKVFGNYGVFNDVMKLNLAISSFGGQFWRQCAYALDPFSGTATDYDLSHLDAAFINGRACPSGPVSTEANWASGSTPTGLTFIENTDNRGTENVVPGLKPYRQHESAFGIDFQLSKNYIFEARWDRRRLDHAIEDAAIFNAATGSETFTNVNPGEGTNATFNGFSNFLYGPGGPACDPSVCQMVKAERSYDGLEFRLDKTGGSRWSGMFSYTYSRLRGNYTGLTSTDELDGFSGRNAPNNSRAFDEPYFQYTSHGTADNGLLPTDRPNVLKGYAYYRMPWGGGRNTTMIGLFQNAMEGTPQSTFIDVGYAGGNQPYFPVYVEGRGKWANLTQDAAGNITLTGVTTKRTPWFTQSDVSLVHDIKVNKNNESQVLGFEVNVTNLFNQHAVTAYWDGVNSLDSRNALAPGGQVIFTPGQYQAFMSPYNWVSTFNNNFYVSGANPRPMTLSSWYGQPFLYQVSRAIRLKVRFNF